MYTEDLKILLVEDDVNLGFLLTEFLEGKGFFVKLYRDGETGYNGFRSGEFNFCILDIMLPNLDGYTLAKKIRAENKDIPIILLTAKSMPDDKIKGYKLGIDDYITKPFNEDELYYRIKAILTRVNKQNDSSCDDMFRVGDYTFSFNNQALNYGTDCRRLTEKESEVLRLLCISKGKIIKKEDILTAVWGESDYFKGRSLDVFMSKLRKYLEKDKKINIESIPRVGYILTT